MFLIKLRVKTEDTHSIQAYKPVNTMHHWSSVRMIDHLSAASELRAAAAPGNHL